MASMGVTPTAQLHTALQSHIQALMNECFAYKITGETKHMYAAREQLSQFVAVNFLPVRR